MDILLPIGLLTANSLAYSFVIFFFFFAMRGRLQFFSYLFKVMIPEAVYTGIVALLIYKILLEVDIRIRDGEKRSMFLCYEKFTRKQKNYWQTDCLP